MRPMNIALCLVGLVCVYVCAVMCECTCVCMCVYVCMHVCAHVWGVQCCLPHTGVSELGEKGSELAVKKLWSGMGQHLSKGH